MTKSNDRTVEAGVIGTGQYATAIVTQAESIPNLNVPIVADTNLDAARRAYELAGVDASEVIVAENRNEALAGVESKKRVVVEDAELLMDLPIDVIAEGTGNPTAGAVHAAKALANGKHVVMITKETDVVAGVGLRRMARQAGLVYSAADGDQPSHLISLVRWCRQIGLEVLCGGKFAEIRLSVDVHNRQLRYRRGQTRDLTPAEADLFRPMLGQANRSRLLETIDKRKELLAESIDVRTDDLTELGIVANATGMTVERERLHHPVVWPNEMPTVLAPEAYGGLLEGTGIIELATYLRSANDTSMGGGVYVTVHAENDYSREIISGKGHICNEDGTSCLIFRPYHLCGVETPYSILSAALRGTPTSGWEMTQHYDSFGRAKQDLPAGTELHGAHDTSWETFLAPSTRISESEVDDPIPYHIATGSRLTQGVSAGQVMTKKVVADVTESPLWKLRVAQEVE